MSGGERAAASRERPSVADVAFFAPLGLALDASKLVPDLAERGRRELQRRIDSAALVGRLALRYGPAFVGGASRGWGPVGPRRPAGRAGPEASSARVQAAARTPLEPAATGGEAVTGPSGLAIPGYDALSALQVVGRLGALRPDELEAVAAYERAHRARRTILAKASQLAAATAPGAPEIPAEDQAERSLPGGEGQSPP